MDYKKNQIFDVKITDMTSDGEGIGKVDGFPFFIKDTMIGDEAEICVTKMKKNYGYGRLKKLLKPSVHRIECVCPLHRQCGGCQIQAMDYRQQLAFKQGKVKNNLIHIGGFNQQKIEEVMEPIVGMEVPLHYRNKAQYPIGTDKEGNPIAGFYAGRTHTIIANTNCSLGVEENQEILEIILSYMKENQVPAYDEERGEGLIRHVLLRKGFYSGQIMVCLVINLPDKSFGSRALQGSPAEPHKGNYLPAQEKLVHALTEISGMTSISVSINTTKTNVIMGREIYTIWGEDTIQDTIFIKDADREFADMGRGITFTISPLSFYQVNPVQTEKLYSLARSYAELTGEEIVWDLYCGIGTISLFLADVAKKVYGVEVIPEAIRDARVNAETNGIANAEFFTGKVEEILPGKYEKEDILADVVVIDPPRKGCDVACLETILKMMPKKVVYISCDSATLARDLKILCAGGYELKKVRAVDMFPMTVHTECVCALHRRDT